MEPDWVVTSVEVFNITNSGLDRPLFDDSRTHMRSVSMSFAE